MKPTPSNHQITIVLCLFLSISFNGFSQKAPMKFGKVDKADLEMKTYPQDTSAAAVVLCSYGYFNANDFNFTRMMRIKILKKEGTSYGDRVFYVDSKTNIRGITFNLENGEIVESKLKSESIFKERITDDNYRFRVAMPNVKEGSIIDIQYTHQLIPSEWRFQEEIPVRWSELIVEQSTYVDFRKSTFGSIPFAEQSDTRWVAKNVPAFKREAYLNSIENYISKFEFDISSISFPGYFKAYTTSWEAVSKTLEESEHFGKTMQLALFLNSIANDIEAKYTNPLDKMKAAYEAVKVIKWNEHVSLYTSQPNLSYPYNKKLGNSADINLTLVQLLKKLDFEAYPVAMSTRSNGLLRVFSPSLEKLNYTIACAKHNNKVYLFDATEELMPFGLLPLRTLNVQGRVITYKNADWVQLIVDKKDKELIQYELKLDASDLLTGKITKTRVDYSAFDFRKDYKEFNSQDEYLKDFEGDNNGLLVENCTISNLDSIYKPLKEEYEVKIKNKVSRVGDLIYVNPMLYEQMTENPFKLEERKYPVDFGYPIESMYQLKLTLPEGMKVEQMPKPLVIKLPDNSATCTYQITNSGGVISLSYKFQINKSTFQPLEYYNLKTLFTEMVKKHAEPIVLKAM